MIDPLVSAAFVIHSNRKAFALLLGSGISRSAGIPTGWEVIEDIIRKIAAACNESCEPNPANWYTARFNLRPQYSDVLENLASTPLERRGLLRSYFEPTDDEREKGLKQPSRAHMAVAEMVRDGYVNVIITTNFDRLLERSLEQLGIAPVIISTSDAARGCAPLHQNVCTVIKVNGDYLDTTLRNTTDELGEYAPEMGRLLDTVFDEYGLIIAGWSGEWDSALRDALARCTNHRYSTYWTHRSALTEVAAQIATARRAERIPIADADGFFTKLVEHITAIDQFGLRHPLSSKVAVATAKRYLPDERFRIQLADLVKDESGRVGVAIREDQFPVAGITWTPDNLLARIHKYDATMETLLPLAATVCYWGSAGQSSLCVKALERVANRPNLGGDDRWIRLRLYPALALYYACSIASLASGHHDTFLALFERPRFKYYGREEMLWWYLYAGKVIDHNDQQTLPGYERRYTPISDHLAQCLRERFSDLVPDDSDFAELFDRVEYIRTLLYADARERLGKTFGGPQFHGPSGQFAWKIWNHADNVVKRVEREIETQGENWPLLTVGAFGSSLDRLKQVKSGLDESITSLRWN